MPRRLYRYIAAGAIVAVAGVTLAIIARERYLHSEFEVYTYLDDSEGVAPSSPVRLNGIVAGHVVDLALTGSRDPNRVVRIHMRLPMRLLPEIPDDSTAAVTAPNLLGDKYINITRGVHPKHVQPGSEIKSSQAQDIPSIIVRGSVELTKINAILDRVNGLLRYVDSGQGSLGQIVHGAGLQNRITRTTRDYGQMMADIDKSQGISHLQEIPGELAKPQSRLDEMLRQFRQGRGTLGKLLNDPLKPTLSDEGRSTVREANQIIDEFKSGARTKEMSAQIAGVAGNFRKTMDRIDSGQGTVGQFVVNPQFEDSLRGVERQVTWLTTQVPKHPSKYVSIRLALF